MGDPFEELQLLWEKAKSLKNNGFLRKETVKECQPNISNARQKVELGNENKTGRGSKKQVHLNPDKVNCKETTKSRIPGVRKSGCKSTICKKAGSDLQSPKKSKDYDINVEKKAANVKRWDTQNTHEQNENDVSFPKDEEKTHPTEHCFSNKGSPFGIKLKNKEGGHVYEDAPVFRTQDPVHTKVGNNIPGYRDNFKEDFVSGCTNSVDRETIVSGETLFQKGKTTNETRGSDDQVKNDSKAEPVTMETVGKDPPRGTHNVRDKTNKCNETKTGPKVEGQQEDKDVDDCFNELQMLWQKANLLKKYGVNSVDYAKDGQQTSSSQKVEVEKENEKMGKYSKRRVHLNPGKVSRKENNKSRNAGDGNSRRNSTFRKKKPFADSDLNPAQETVNSFKCSPEKPKRRCSFSAASCLYTESMNKETDKGVRFSTDNEKNHSSKHSFFTNEASFGVKLRNHKEEAPVFGKETKVKTDISNEPSNFSSKLRREFENGCGKSADKENVFPKDETQVVDDHAENVVDGKYSDKKIEEDGSDIGTCQDCLINDRDKLKETDEYKRAEEEEWVSRQQVLRHQAVEAQKMRKVLKRKKAESLRELDIKNRQNQRVEEVRKTQKKDEEDLNMKEKLRAEVRRELQQLEKKSFNMCSLLRRLGVHVSGGLKPTPHEMRAAYKKALLSFHPDRVPASDIRKLVEAEEKFKLILRMKEKFLPTS